MSGSLQHGEIGWDVFTLEYRVDAPVDTIIDPEAMINYMKIFNHLWQMKRVERALGLGWMRMVGGARSFLKIPGEYSQPFRTMNNNLLILGPRTRNDLASGSCCLGRDDTFHSTNASSQPAGSNCMFVEGPR
jgi:hypothetical protein